MRIFKAMKGMVQDWVLGLRAVWCDDCEPAGGDLDFVGRHAVVVPQDLSGSDGGQSLAFGGTVRRGEGGTSLKGNFFHGEGIGHGL